MLKLSLWGKNNPWKARVIIIFSHVILFQLAWFTGNELVSIGINLPGYLKYLIVLISLLTFITYPSAKNKSAYKIVPYYTRQKICDFLFALSTFGMVVCLAAPGENISTFFSDIHASTLPSIEKGKTKPKGVIYIVTGAGGQSLYNPEQTTDKDSWQKFTVKFESRVHTFTIVDVSGKTLTLRQIDINGKEVDKIKITK